MNFDQNGWGQPVGFSGNNHVPTELGFFVSEEYYNKIDRRIGSAKSAVAQAEAGKRISDFRGGPFNKRFFQPPINDSDAFANVAYWMSVAAMATGNKRLITAASKYAASAERWSSPFLRMKTGGIADIYRGAGAALRKNAAQDINDSTVRYVAGIFTAQGDPARSEAQAKRAVQQDPVSMAKDAVAQTVTQAPAWKRIPWWGYAIAGTAILGTILYLSGPARSVKEEAGRLIRRKRER